MSFGGMPIKDRMMRSGAAATLLLFFALVFIGLDWPSASAALRNLRLAYPGQHARLVTLKSVSFVNACGFFVLGAGSARLKYMESRDGLVAEKTPNQWLTFAADRPFEDDWEYCVGHSGRGHAFDFAIDPIVVALLGLT